MAKAAHELYAGLWQDPAEVLSATFPIEHVDKMIVVSGIEVWSLCAHHLLPFSATVSIGYIADTQVLGLSKFGRIRPGTQEQLVADIADRVEKVTQTSDVAVTASGVHLCMAMRGIRTPATMTTSVARGAFRDRPETRAEWLTLVGRSALTATS